jgi:hypothetical protein
MSKKTDILSKAAEILANEPGGLRYTELCERLKEALPAIEANTIYTYVGDYVGKGEGDVYKPERGFFIHAKYRETQVAKDVALSEQPVAPVGAPGVREEDFYGPFAEWIQNELEECSKAIALGGNKFKDKWGTPDVIGIREPKKSAIIKLDTEIVSVEIKTDTSSIITAFGQACSYKLFSHKSYLVVPITSSEADLGRIDALCRIFGIGLILFDAVAPRKPDFQIRVRAAKHDPDMFYVDRNMKAIEDELFG